MGTRCRRSAAAITSENEVMPMTSTMAPWRISPSTRRQRRTRGAKSGPMASANSSAMTRTVAGPVMSGAMVAALTTGASSGPGPKVGLRRQ